MRVPTVCHCNLLPSIFAVVNAENGLSVAALILTPTFGMFCLVVAKESRTFARALPWLSFLVFILCYYLTEEAYLGIGEDAVGFIALCSLIGVPLSATQIKDDK
jgi:hypothetical protein